jgi:ferredoxin/flavodoxin---NADP+ reductase
MTSSTDQELRVAIVGAGPAGFYAAGHLLATERPTHVDLFDRLPTPFGLVRAGVAPDHPKIKSVVRVYEKTAAQEGFRFFGGVELGRDLHRADLLERYHAVIYAIGAAIDRRLGIPGEDLPGSEAATDFVGWYNGHPDYPDREFDLNNCERVIVVGNGNVALDCARMLALSADELRMTDCADHAIDMLASDAVQEIVILGRRGPAQASFTNPELLELGELELADVIVDPADVELDDASQAWLDSDQANKTSRENVRILREYAEREPAGKPKRIVLRFLTSPVELQGDERVERIVVERNRLEPRDDGSLAARPTGERETLECGLVLRSIGYKGIAIPEVPFDDRRGTIPNVAGRVVDGEHHVTGEYVTGWIRRGPSGVIGTNKKDGQEAASSLLEDTEAGLLNEPVTDGDIADLLAERGVEPISWGGWERIDAHEQDLGAGTRPRVKLTRYELLHGAARGEK